MRKKKVRRYTAGGKVSGPGTKTSDSILARLSKGEYVLPAESVAQVGLPTLEALRQQGLRARAGAPPGYAMGGFIADSQIMEARAKADPLDVASGRFDRENPMMRGMQPGLPRAGSFSEQTNPVMDAYRQARSSADPLDVASGRFDRENPLSRMVQGGLPRFAEGGRVWTPSELQKLYGGAVPPTQANPAQAEALSRAAAERARDWANVNAGNMGPKGAAAQARYAPSTIPTQPTQSSFLSRAAPVAGRVAGGVGMALYPSALGDGTMAALEQSQEEQKKLRDYVSRMIHTDSSVGAEDGAGAGLTQARLPTPSATVPQAKPTAIDHRDRMAMEQANRGPAMQAAGYTQLPGTDTYRRALPAPGGFGETTYSLPGVPGVGGGNGVASFMGLQGPRLPGGFVGYAGTPETAGMTQAQATAYNVANLDRQTEALRSLREAQNPGITTGQAGRAFGDLVSIGTPGGNFGDEAMQRQKVLGMLTDAGRPGVTKARRLALLEGAQQMAGLPQSGATRLPGEQGGADPYQMARLQLEANKFGLDQQRFGLDQDKARQEEALKQQQMALDAHFKLPKDAQETRMNQLQGAYYDAAMKSGPESPEAQKLAAIINLINKARPALDLNALMQQK
jgi:hypothetical protein